MLTANTQLSDGTASVTAEHATFLGGCYYCPNCKGEVTLKNGLVKIPHFAHKAAASCEYAGESMLHIKMKFQIFQTLNATIKYKVRAIELEKPLGIIRPDVYIEGNKRRIGIEVQASVLTPSQILERTRRYHKLGVYVLWVVPFEKKRLITFDPKIIRGPSPLSIRLKEYERVISYMYYKTLILWNVERDPAMGFMAFKLEDSYTDACEYYNSDREYQYHAPRPHKMLRIIGDKVDSLQLPEFEPTVGKEFSMPKAGYTLPQRSILTYRWED
ncbi:competence protein CoiA [Chitinophaga filiformis]|uniref:Competence protein CoiA-like family protein n=1 Tax=Chitinophaga filiformis TaxID=104663 RepID=A0A1G7MJN6_CHIFI|nr:competence protein CoiA family protein [Chitinophaga filiformis]SDF61933.1 Competence protein CoiA-like family protein [Chitinophaga filiformis]